VGPHKVVHSHYSVQEAKNVVYIMHSCRISPSKSDPRKHSNTAEELSYIFRLFTKEIKWRPHCLFSKEIQGRLHAVCQAELTIQRQLQASKCKQNCIPSCDGQTDHIIQCKQRSLPAGRNKMAFLRFSGVTKPSVCVFGTITLFGYRALHYRPRSVLAQQGSDK
jgi:hypothetical protein